MTTENPAPADARPERERPAPMWPVHESEEV